MFTRKLLNIFFSLFALSSFLSTPAQSKNDKISQKSFNEIRDLINSVKDPRKRIFYTEFYVEKAKKEKNIDKLIFGYHTLSYFHGFYPGKKQIQYADSIIQITHKIAIQHILQGLIKL